MKKQRRQPFPSHLFLYTARVLFPILCALCVIFIFYNSSRTGSASGGVSSQLTLAVNRHLQSLGLPFSVSETLLRKLGHVAEYALLGILMLSTLWLYVPHRPLHILCIPLAGLMVAASDEFFQRFIPGREGRITDILIDFLGLLLGCILAAAFISLLRKLLRRLRSSTTKTAANSP